MTKVVVEVLSEEGMKLLENLQNLQVLRFEHRLPEAQIKIDESWVGSISAEAAEKWLRHVDESRNEWDRDF